MIVHTGLGLNLGKPEGSLNKTKVTHFLADFYQVVEVKPASVALRKIGAKAVPGSEGFMCESLMPEKDAFITKGFQALTKDDRDITPENPTITKKVGFYVKEDGSLRYYIPVPYGWCDLWDGKQEYSSWYA